MLIPIQVNRKPSGGGGDDDDFKKRYVEMLEAMQVWVVDIEARIKALEENTLYNRFIRWSKYG